MVFGGGVDVGGFVGGDDAELLAANRMAEVWPMPEAAPVTMTDFPVKRSDVHPYLATQAASPSLFLHSSMPGFG